MPARKRAQEVRRRIRKEVAKAEAKEEAEALEAFALALAEADYLHDYWWREYEDWDWWCCPSCDYNHPLVIQAAAQEEINAYLNRNGDR